MTHVLDKNPDAYVSRLNAAYGELLPEDILQRVSLIFSGEIAFANSFGLEDVVIQQMLLDHAKGAVDSFVLDTGRLPAETYDLIDRWRVRSNLKLRLFNPDRDQLEPFVEEHGPNSFYQSIELRKRCCAIRKIEPLSRALTGKKAWITGLRREQSQARSRLEVFERDEAGRIKINPLASWSLEQVRDYIEVRKVPYNVLHDRGYPSVGCAPCTRAVEAGEDIRAGRWWWELNDQRECGLHQHGVNVRQEEHRDAR